MHNEGAVAGLERLSEVGSNHLRIVEMIGGVELSNASHR
jgi:hypothetical protein